VTLGAIALTLAILVIPAGAAAKERTEVTPGSFVAGFQLPGSHGYDLSVIAIGHKQVQLIASKGQTSATYLTRGRASRKGIEADFGSLGKIAVRFDGSPIPGKNRGGSERVCKGRKAIRERGAFHGTIRFAGENGFTEVDADQARGRFYRSFSQVCRRTSPKPASKPPRLPRQPKSGQMRFQSDTLNIESRLGDGNTGLFLSRDELRIGPSSKTAFALNLTIASKSERLGQVEISRTVFMVGENAFLRLSEPGTYPILATAKLPKPFTGTATYREDKGLAPTWTGSLAVRLPGAGLVPLTGEGFKSSLCRASTEKAINACMRQLSTTTAQAAALSLPQGNGSQSQAFWDARLSWSR
jgi:hypothetical protein